MRFSENKKIVPVLLSTDINAGVDCDSINMKSYHHAAFVVLFGADLSGDAVLTLYSGATDGEKTSALTFSYRYGGAAVGSANCDVLSDEATSEALTCTGTTFVSRMLIIEIDASSMDTANNEEWLTLSISDAAAAGYCYVVAFLDPRYASSAGNSALT